MVFRSRSQTNEVISAKLQITSISLRSKNNHLSRYYIEAAQKLTDPCGIL